MGKEALGLLSVTLPLELWSCLRAYYFASAPSHRIASTLAIVTIIIGIIMVIIIIISIISIIIIFRNIISIIISIILSTIIVCCYRY